jgi:pimeloyl-ACP methyl ester carboxylesterase
MLSHTFIIYSTRGFGNPCPRLVMIFLHSYTYPAFAAPFESVQMFLSVSIKEPVQNTTREAMPWIENNQARLFYTDEGTGTSALLLHGWACDSHDWSWQIPVLLNAGFRVIAMDHRGHGRSTAPHGDYKPQTLADDAAALLDHLQAGPAIIISHSMGTVVASALSVQHPQHVKALVLIEPAYHTPGELLGPFVEAMAAPNSAELAAGYFSASFYTPDTPAFLKSWHMRRAIGTLPHVHAGCISGLFGAGGIGRLEIAQEYMKQRKAPRLAVYASEATASVERGLPYGPHDEIHVIENASHWLHQQRSEDFNQLLLRWLNAPGAF